MTIAISIKTSEGIILASDSATTISNDRHQVLMVYNNENKLANLYYNLPIGANTWGLGHINSVSISSHFKDFRNSLMDSDNGIDPENYTMEEVISRFKSFIYDDRYTKSFQDGSEKPMVGFYIAGYSSDAIFPELYLISIGDTCQITKVRDQQQTGINWAGDIDALNRLILGYPINLETKLMEKGIAREQVQAVMETIRELEIPITQPWMPIQDSIDLAEFLAQTTKNHSRYTPGHQIVGGDIDIAVITRHDKFKWVKRKHYYSQELNPIRQ